MAAVKRLCVYCGSSGKVDQLYRDGALKLGGLMAADGIELVYGGGRVGLMGLVADGVLAGGGRAIGIIPGHLHDREIGHPGLSELHVVDNMHERKRRMFEMSDAFAVLPGGFGTLDETFEIITWRLLELHDKPVIIVNQGNYWAPLITLMDHVIDQRFAGPAVRRLYDVVDGVDAVLPAIAAAAAPRMPAESDLV